MKKRLYKALSIVVALAMVIGSLGFKGVKAEAASNYTVSGSHTGIIDLNIRIVVKTVPGAFVSVVCANRHLLWDAFTSRSATADENGEVTLYFPTTYDYVSSVSISAEGYENYTFKPFTSIGTGLIHYDKVVYNVTLDNGNTEDSEPETKEITVTVVGPYDENENAPIADARVYLAATADGDLLAEAKIVGSDGKATFDVTGKSLDGIFCFASAEGYESGSKALNDTDLAYEIVLDVKTTGGEDEGDGDDDDENEIAVVLHFVTITEVPETGDTSAEIICDKPELKDAVTVSGAGVITDAVVDAAIEGYKFVKIGYVFDGVEWKSVSIVTYDETEKQVKVSATAEQLEAEELDNRAHIYVVYEKEEVEPEPEDEPENEPENNDETPIDTIPIFYEEEVKEEEKTEVKEEDKSEVKEEEKTEVKEEVTETEVTEETEETEDTAEEIPALDEGEEEEVDVEAIDTAQGDVEDEDLDVDGFGTPQGLPATGVVTAGILYGLGALCIAAGGVVVAKTRRKDEE